MDWKVHFLLSRHLACNACINKSTQKKECLKRYRYTTYRDMPENLWHPDIHALN